MVPNEADAEVLSWPQWFVLSGYPTRNKNRKQKECFLMRMSTTTDWKADKVEVATAGSSRIAIIKSLILAFVQIFVPDWYFGAFTFKVSQRLATK